VHECAAGVSSIVQTYPRDASIRHGADPPRGDLVRVHRATELVGHDARENAEARHRRAEAEELAIRASITAAEQRGELIPDMLQALQRGVGRSPAEAVKYISQMADYEDARASAARRKLLAEHEAGFCADTSAPGPLEVERGARAEQHAVAFEARQIETRRRVAEQKATDARTIALARAVNRDG
jgi:hypothetical protein